MFLTLTPPWGEFGPVESYQPLTNFLAPNDKLQSGEEIRTPFLSGKKLMTIGLKVYMDSSPEAAIISYKKQ